MAYAPVGGQAKVTGTVFTGVYTGNVTAGNLLVVGAGFDVTAAISASQTAGTATIVNAVGTSGVFTSLQQQNMKGATERAAVLIALVTVTGSCTVTFAASGAGFCDNWISEWNLAVGGPVPASPGDVVVSANWVATPASSGTTASSSQANNLVLNFCSDSRTQALATDTGNGFTSLLNSNPNFTTLVQYKTVSSIATYTAASVVTGSPTDGASITVVIKEAAAAGGGGGDLSALIGEPICGSSVIN